MKKLLTALFAICLAISVQGQTYTINSQLRLNTVHEGTASDSILVRGADKIIKYIPKSDILLGVETPTIQAVLDKGNQSTTRLELFNGSNTNIVAGGFAKIANSTSESQSSANEIYTSNLAGKYSKLTADAGISLNTSNVANSGLIFKSDNVTAIRTLQSPNTSGTIATENYVQSKSPAMYQSSGVPFGNSLVDSFLAENLGREILYYDNSASDLYNYDYAASDWVKVDKNQLDLKVIDSYNGTRLAPKDAALNGYFISKQANQNVGFYAENTDNTGNAAQASLTVKGSGALYNNYIGMSYYNANYYVTALRNTGAIYSDKPVSLMTWNSNPIDFRTGSAFASTTSKFKINGDGQLVVGVAPTTNNTINSLLGRDTSGNIVTVTNALISTAAVPTSSTSSGTKGQIAFDANFAYICTATNTWGRFPLTTTF